jgi:hypothetical protein
VRSGDEPNHARSPLRLRLGLALFGLVAALIASYVVRSVAPTPVVVAFVVVAVIALVDLVVVLRHLRSGPHYQPGPEIPPYRPADRPRRPKPAALTAPLSERTRMRRYLAIMITCLVLITLAWTWVRLWSTTTAVIMSAIAAVLPPIAVIVANFGVELPPDPPRPDDPPRSPGPPGSGGSPRGS